MPIQLNCPKCPQRMEFLYITSDSVLVYRCSAHGEWHLGYGGIRPPGELVLPQEPPEARREPVGSYKWEAQT